MPLWLLLALACLVLPPAPAALADDLGAYGDEAYWDLVETSDLKKLMALDGIAPFEDQAPLWDYVDPDLQREVDLAIADLGLKDEADRRQLSVALIDITVPRAPKVAAVNGDEMMYAASLPKIAVLLGAFEKIAQGKMDLDPITEGYLGRMIKKSSNRAATEMMHRVGKEYIARVLLSPRYRLYDPDHNGGLWVGKDYAKAGLWRRDPLHNLSHGATAIQVARFYYLLETENLVTPEHSRKMKEILRDSEIDHKFVRALHRVNPEAKVARKSGSWSTYHSDSVLVERDGRAYIAVALSNDKRGSRWLGRIITALDEIIFPGDSFARGDSAIPANRSIR
jgi:beta-lactamase class A